MKKLIVSMFMITSLLSVGITTPVQAAEGSKDVIVSYESNRPLSIKGEKEVIKGTANHSYQGFLDDTQADVVWSIKGATSKNTRIDQGGFLIVGVDETASMIEVIATSKNNSDNVASMQVALIEKTYTIVSVEKKDDITMKYGTTEKELLKRLGEYDTFQVTIKTNDNKVYVIDVNQAMFHSEIDVIDANGIVKEGSFDVIYDLILPSLQIEYDGTILTKESKESNIIGDASTHVKVTIMKNEEPTKPTLPERPSVPEKPSVSEKPSVAEKPIKGPNTGDGSNPMLYAVVGGASLLGLLLLWKKRKKQQEEI